jgi:hypothetical protein
MKIVTVATHIDGYMPWLKMSCERYNMTLYTLGFGEKWQGYNWKFLKMKEFLRTVDPNETICFVDAYDVILLRDPSSLEDDFNAFCKLTGKKIIVGCDKPKPMYMKALAYATFGKCDDEMLNSGTYIGKASDLLYMIDEMSRISNEDPSVDDQILLKDWCSANTNLIHIDCDNLFFIVSGDPQRDLEIKKTKNAYFLHAPGNTYIDDIIEELGYTMTDEEKMKIKEYHRKSLIKKVKYYSSFKVYKLIFFILILYIIYKIVKRSKSTL